MVPCIIENLEIPGCDPYQTQNVCFHFLQCSGLERDLQVKLHGQHLVQSVVLKAIQGFINNPESNKPLTLSFHGWSGTGKNFVARLVADNLYRDGIKSECVRLFIAPFHFPHTRLVDVYKVSKAWQRTGTFIVIQWSLVNLLPFTQDCSLRVNPQTAVDSLKL